MNEGKITALEQSRITVWSSDRTCHGHEMDGVIIAAAGPKHAGGLFYGCSMGSCCPISRRKPIAVKLRLFQ